MPLILHGIHIWRHILYICSGHAWTVLFVCVRVQGKNPAEGYSCKGPTIPHPASGGPLLGCVLTKAADIRQLCCGMFIYGLYCTCNVYIYNKYIIYIYNHYIIVYSCAQQYTIYDHSYVLYICVYIDLESICWLNTIKVNIFLILYYSFKFWTNNSIVDKLMHKRKVYYNYKGIN